MRSGNDSALPVGHDNLINIDSYYLYELEGGVRGERVALLLKI